MYIILEAKSRISQFFLLHTKQLYNFSQMSVRLVFSQYNYLYI